MKLIVPPVYSKHAKIHSNAAGVLIVTDLQGREYVFVDVLLCVVGGKQFYEYKIEPFLKSYGFTARCITSLSDIRLVGAPVRGVSTRHRH
eukprot:5696364-Prymnesium_polylepis.1